MADHIRTEWLGGMAFSSDNPSGQKLRIDAAREHGGEDGGFRPKALMLSSLAGCSGLDVASLMGKMRLQVERFEIEIEGDLTDEHPKYYHKVRIHYHFHGPELDEKQLRKAVDLSIEKYCGVMEMFRRFAELDIQTSFHHG